MAPYAIDGAHSGIRFKRAPRADFGLTWNQALEAGGVLVSARVHVEIDVHAIRAKPA
jgi:hypothetical protein